MNNQDNIIREAKEILYSRLQTAGALMASASAARDYLSLQLADRESEVFCVMFLDSQHRLISFDEMFQGTIDGASVWPREVLKAALKYNAAAVILAHNHPSGSAEPSQADIRITERLKAGLELIDVRVLDHMIVAKTEVASFAERGLLV